MNEGKPTKTKWWSRPRPEGPVEGATADGDYELRRPQDVVDDERAGTATSSEAEAEAEAGAGAEVDAPAAVQAVAGAEGSDGTRSGGDFELRAPRPQDAAGTESGDFELDLPETAPAETAPAETTPAATAPAETAPSPTADEAPATDAVAERPKPLHDPDPYSTPPYGEPGPWAPAPPVQHPSPTPSHGTAVPMSAHGTPAPPPAHGTPASTPARDTLAATPFSAPHGGPPSPVPPSAGSYEDAPPPANPWQNYDPWAPVPIPLQQTGAGLPGQDGRRKRGRKLLVVGAVVLALVSGGVGGAVGAYLERNGGMADVELPQAGAEPAGRAPDSVAGIAARALPSVVTLHVSGAEEQGTGTGFVLDDRGHILTNNHVVEPAGADGDISVTFHSGDTAKATVVGRDSGYDLAVVKVTDVSGLRPMTLGNSDNVQVGDPVVAIGAPYDLEGTVTSGIISAKERPITAGGESGDGSDVSYVDALQTDAPINPGNSGGPLLDSKARVIGINSAIRSADSGSDESAQSGSIGLGFAIPVNQAKRVAEELINTGKATHPVIGITLDMDYSGDGARVGTKGNDGGPAVIAGGSGDKAGIKSGDVITEVDGQRVHSGEELIVKTRAHRPGDELELTVERGGEELTISLVLGSSDGD